MIPITQITGRLGNQMFQFAYIFSQMKEGLIPDTYVQNPLYFEKYGSEIKQIFGRGIVPNDYVAIHVRRGDYVGNPFYVDLTKTDYYERAMKEFPGAKFKVFSDDKIFVENHPLFKDFEISYGSEIDDLNEMAGAKGIIIANSSFSWWAGYLSCGRVVAPIEWHTDGVERTKLPESWKRI